MRKDSPLLSQASSTQTRQNRHQSEPSHILGPGLPLHANIRPPQHNHGMMMSHHGQGLHRASLLQTNQAMGLQSAHHLSSLPDLPSFSRVPPSTSSGLMQLNNPFPQMEVTRQQNEAHDHDMAMRFGPRNGMNFPPPFGRSGSLNVSNGHHMAQYQGLRNTVSTQPQSLRSIDLQSHSLSLEHSHRST